jgi:hypothetical protein
MRTRTLASLAVALALLGVLATTASQDRPANAQDPAPEQTPIPFSDEMRDELDRIARAHEFLRKQDGSGTRLYLPGTFAVAQVLPADLTKREPNNSSCQAVGPLANSTSYSAAFESTDFDDWFYYDARVGVNIKLTGGGIPTPNQLQVFFADASDCTKVPTTPSAKVDDRAAPELSLAPQTNGRLFIRVVGVKGTTATGKWTLRVAPNTTSGTFEDNDNPCQATPTLASTTYTTNIDDDYDFFEIKVTTASRVKVNIRDFNVPSQLQLRSPIKTGCDAVTSTDRIGEPAFIINGAAEIVADLQPGTYYARMGPPNGTRSGQAYTFAWSIIPRTAAAADTDANSAAPGQPELLGTPAP